MKNIRIFFYVIANFLASVLVSLSLGWFVASFASYLLCQSITCDNTITITALLTITLPSFIFAASRMSKIFSPPNNTRHFKAVMAVLIITTFFFALWLAVSLRVAT